ncbi:hypothetical protein PENSPDRAFT_648237 [Peniophora sp. CONT]|nr:hypothetical protein PENSPDRAFT_648237 [Peniophora sp. CONT]
MAYQGHWDFAAMPPTVPAPPGVPMLHPATFSPHEPFGAVDFAPPSGPPPSSVAEVHHHSPAPPAMISLEEKEPLIPKEIRTRARARVEAQQAASGSGSGSPSGSGGVSRSTRAHERPSPYSRPQPSGSGSGQQKGKRAAGGDSSRPSTSARRMSGSPMNFSPEELAETAASLGGSHSAIGGGGDLSPVVGQSGMPGMRYDATSNAPDHRRIPRSPCRVHVVASFLSFFALALIASPAR